MRIAFKGIPVRRNRIILVESIYFWLLDSTDN